MAAAIEPSPSSRPRAPEAVVTLAPEVPVEGDPLVVPEPVPTPEPVLTPEPVPTPAPALTPAPVSP